MKNFEFYIAVLLLSGSALMASCQKDSVSYNQQDLTNPVSVTVVPPSVWLSSGSTQYYSSGYVGDAMPYFDNGKFYIFYLHDGDGTATGYHPIHAFESADLTHYNYDGRMIPFGNDATQDRALGTGSVVKAGNTYYFYYTGHNDKNWNNSTPVEGVMYATSTDLKNWTKKSGFNLLPPAGYDQNQFRDPYVFFNNTANQYWMLVAARTNGKAVITLFTTADPSKDNWVSQGVFYTTDDNSYTMLECPDVFQIGSYWYMLFSESQTQKTTHYRMATSLSGPWTTPAQDLLDGEYFYAGKTASDGTNRYLFGWAYRKDGFTDYGGKIWGGNLVTHQLIQNSNGTLSVKTPDNVAHLFTQKIPLTQNASTKGSANGNNYTLQDGGVVKFTWLNGQKEINTTISGLQSGAEAGFEFGVDRTSSSDFYKVRLKNGIAYIVKVQGTDEYLDATIAFPYTAGSDIDVSIVIDNNIVVVNINGKTTLTGRIYWLPNAAWGIYCTGGSVSFNNMQLLGL